LARVRLGRRARRAARLRHLLGRCAHAGGDPVAHAAAEDGVRRRGPPRRAAADDHRHDASDDGRRARVVRVARRRHDRRARRADRVHRPARGAADDAREAPRRLRARGAEPPLRPPRRDRAAAGAARLPVARPEAVLVSDRETELNLRQRLSGLSRLPLLRGTKVDGEAERLEAQLQRLSADTTDEAIWNSVELARHPERPYTLDYVERLLEDWVELHGDRGRADDGALVTGIGRLDGRTIALVGHQKGRDVKERLDRQFGMAYPEGYHKAMRVMEIADRFGFPLVSLVDTPGAYPGVAAEQHGQGGAIARSQAAMARLTVPTVACIIGEGGSGGAVAIAVADRVLMQENAIYSVITPEGCAAILWRDAGEAKKAAAAFKPDALHCLELGVIDGIVPEPPGGAQTDPAGAAAALRT